MVTRPLQIDPVEMLGCGLRRIIAVIRRDIKKFDNLVCCDLPLKKVTH